MAAQFALKAALRKSMNRTLRALTEDQLAEQCVCSYLLPARTHPDEQPGPSRRV